MYEFPLQLRNLDRVARHIKVVSVESPYFSVACQKTAGVKVAPGMELMYTVYFRPEEKKVMKCFGVDAVLCDCCSQDTIIHIHVHVLVLIVWSFSLLE